MKPTIKPLCDKCNIELTLVEEEKYPDNIAYGEKGSSHRYYECSKCGATTILYQKIDGSIIFQDVGKDVWETRVANIKSRKNKKLESAKIALEEDLSKIEEELKKFNQEKAALEKELAEKKIFVEKLGSKIENLMEKRKKMYKELSEINDAIEKEKAASQN
ncbi:MAG: hypothetical protein JRI44_06785 [Deltaproteobacteria bacterium]|nr:hypothetical protein [Deltaproteobacteria bacterium]